MIGSKRNYMKESLNHEAAQAPVITVHTKSEGPEQVIDLILEPEKFDELGSLSRPTKEEWSQVMNQFYDEEEKDWHELRLKDMINIPRDRLIEFAILKYAKENCGIDYEKYHGRDINYSKRYDLQGRYIGEAIIVSLTFIPQMSINVK